MTNVVDIKPTFDKKRTEKLLATFKAAGEENIKNAIVEGLKDTIRTLLDIEEPDRDLKLLCIVLDSFIEDINIDGFTEGYVQGFMEAVVSTVIKVEAKLSE